MRNSGDESFLRHKLADNELRLCIEVHSIVPRIRKVDKKWYDYISFK
jgi:hypothetical protein